MHSRKLRIFFSCQPYCLIQPCVALLLIMQEAYKCREAGNMKRISEAEAYRQWHAEERQKAKIEAAFRKLRKDLDWLEGQLTDALARQQAEETERRVKDLTERMLHDKAFAKVLKAYTGHTPYGWRVACGCDGRMKALANDWPVLQETIRRVRIAKGMVRTPCRCEARVMPDATLQLKIQLGYGR